MYLLYAPRQICSLFTINYLLQLFNGDFVDRGSFSVETIFTLFGFKLLFPNHFFMSRGAILNFLLPCRILSIAKPKLQPLTFIVVIILGNHESVVMNQMYGFEGEVTSKYSKQMADLFTEIYNLLPLAHLINGKILVRLYICYCIVSNILKNFIEQRKGLLIILALLSQQYVRTVRYC